MEFETTTETNSVKNTVEIFWMRRDVLAGQQQPGRPISGVKQYMYVTGGGRDFVSTRKWS